MKAEGAPAQSKKDVEMQQSWGLPVQTDNTSMRVVVAGPCSGSSVTLRFMKEILTAHGYKIYDAPDSELMVPHKNKFFKRAKKKLIDLGEEPSNNRVIVEAMALYHQDALSRGEMLLLKSFPKMFRDTFVGMKKLGMRFSHMYRWNSLDRCVCTVRDCFPAGRSYGFPVYANGTEADLCFQRRRSAEKTKAMFPQGNAELCVKKQAKQVRHEIEDIEKIGSHGQSSGDMSVSYEDLFAFEHTSDETTFNVSFRAWVSLTSPMMAGQEVNERIISDILRRKQNTMRPIASHREVIYNIDDVEEEFGSDKSLQQFLRETR
jgi:hypothetical protein